jgi:hypothetical protein
MGRRRGIGMALVKIHIPNRRHLRLLCELQKQLASPVRSKKSTLSLRRPEQKQNAPGLTRLAKRTLRQLGPAQTNPWILNGARPKRLSVVCDSSRKGGDGHELRPQTKSFS